CDTRAVNGVENGFSPPASAAPPVPHSDECHPPAPREPVLLGVPPALADGPKPPPLVPAVPVPGSYAPKKPAYPPWAAPCEPSPPHAGMTKSAAIAALRRFAMQRIVLVPLFLIIVCLL